MTLLLLLLACAPPQWQECYHPQEALEGVPLQGAVLEVECTWETTAGTGVVLVYTE